jgi:hypothetical protein
MTHFLAWTVSNFSLSSTLFKLFGDSSRSGVNPKLNWTYGTLCQSTTLRCTQAQACHDVAPGYVRMQGPDRAERNAARGVGLGGGGPSNLDVLEQQVKEQRNAVALQHKAAFQQAGGEWFNVMLWLPG